MIVAVARGSHRRPVPAQQARRLRARAAGDVPVHRRRAGAHGRRAATASAAATGRSTRRSRRRLVEAAGAAQARRSPGRPSRSMNRRAPVVVARFDGDGGAVDRGQRERRRQRADQRHAGRVADLGHLRAADRAGSSASASSRIAVAPFGNMRKRDASASRDAEPVERRRRNARRRSTRSASGK